MSQHLAPSVGPRENSYRLLVSTSVSPPICSDLLFSASFLLRSIHFYHYLFRFVQLSPRSVQIHLPNVQISRFTPFLPISLRYASLFLLKSLDLFCSRTFLKLVKTFSDQFSPYFGDLFRKLRREDFFYFFYLFIFVIYSTR